MRNATLILPVKGNKILLGVKKKGFGIGKLNGFGGKQQEKESVEETAVRELEEEIGIKAKKENLRKVAAINFFFPESKKEFNQTVHIFFADNWQGNPKESEEMNFEWHDIKNIPFERMWDSDRYWLPKVLEGKRIKGTFFFNLDETTKSQEIKEVEKL